MNTAIGGALAAALAAAPLAAQSAAGPHRILWVQGIGKRDEAFFRAVRGLGFDAVNLNRGVDPELPGRHGLGYYLDQPGGKGVLELTDAVWQPALASYEASRQPADLQRPACLSDPDVTGAFLERTMTSVAALRDGAPLAVALADEASVTRHANPLDFCFGPHCRSAFVAAMQKRYGELAALNQAWGTEFSAWEHVQPLTTDQVRRRELGGLSLPVNLRPWNDHREFMDSLFADTVQRAAAAVGEALPGTPVGLTGMQPPAAFGGHDYRRLMPLLSLYEAYDVGGARELAASLARGEAREIRTLFPPPEGQPAALVRAQYADALAHGVWGVVAWSGEDVLDSEGRPSAYGRELARAFREYATAAAAFAGATLQRSPVWVVESQASVRAWWMIDSAGDGMSWVRRLSSYEAAHSTSQAARSGWIHLLEDLGLQPMLVPEEELAERLPRERPLAVILPACIALSDGAVFALRVFTMGGGTLVADHSPAFYDQDLALRATPALDELFGVQSRGEGQRGPLVRGGRVPERARLRSGAGVAEPGLRGSLGERAGDYQVFLENPAGRGRAFYLNLAVCEYSRVRLDPERVAPALDLRQRVRQALRHARVNPPLEVRGEGLPTCVERMLLRAADGRRLIAVRIQALSEPRILAKLAEEGIPEVELGFPFPVRLRDLVSGRELGPGNVLRARLDPYGALLLEDLTGR